MSVRKNDPVVKSYENDMCRTISGRNKNIHPIVNEEESRFMIIIQIVSTLQPRLES